MREPNTLLPIIVTPEEHCLTYVNTVLDDRAFAEEMQASVGVLMTATTPSKTKLTVDDSSKRRGISLEAAANTMQRTTQRGIRTVANPAVGRRFRTNNWQLRCRRLAVNLFTDTGFATIPSQRKNKCAQIFGDLEGWTRVHPMKLKAKAHFALLTLFARDGVPILTVMDGAREQMMGEFRHKAKEAGCRAKATKPHTPWSNAAEGIIRELKKGTMQKMLKSRCPKTSWDDCMELELMIRSHTTKHSFGLQGETPETRALGVTADISTFAEFGWCQWVMFRDTSVTHPEDNEVLGRHPGPSFDIGPAMTAQILKGNGQVVHRSTQGD